jgi:Protein of unknown function (DUF3078)
MSIRILKIFLIFIFITIYSSAFSQENFKKTILNDTVIDSLKRRGVILNDSQNKREIILSTSQALKFLQQRYHPQFWKDINDPLRQAFGQLVYEAAHQPSNSLRNTLTTYPFDSLSIPWDKFYIWEPLRLKVPVISKTAYHFGIDSTAKADTNLIAGRRDSLNFKPPDILRTVPELKDTTIMVIIDTLNEVTSLRPGFPFKYYNYPFQGDSIKAAVRSLLSYLDERDSSIVYLTGIGKSVTPIWMNSKSGEVIRYWLKNEFSDSVSVWIANPSKNKLGFYLEQGVSFRRPVRQGNYTNAKVNSQILDNSKLLILRNLALKPRYWKYHAETSFVLNQASLSNWVKGGESSISTALDVTGYVDYNNKELKISSENFARLKFGYIATGQEGIRKNIDLLETNSKLNHKAFGKFDFSAILLFKTQIALGRNYFKTATGHDTSNVVSKFMNPATLTIGLGLDFKPNKTTSINFSPLSYKGTFVTDTVHIDQTQYGIAKHRKSLNEPGVSFMITNEFKPIETVSIVNRLQLFTNYIHNPQNVDVDWEMIVTAKLNWFSDVRFNTHLIFDDDTKTDEQYKNGQPVLKPDGTQKKTARIQFKEMLGLSLFFRF